MELLVSEIFYSIQGEGPFLGRPSIFLRLAGCNLECVWCDTKYTWLFSEKQLKRIKSRIPKNKIDSLGSKTFDKGAEASKISVSDLEEKISQYPVKNLVITGGEPLLQKTVLKNWLQDLIRKGFSIEIETNGTISPLDLPATVHYNVSPKLSNSFNPLEKRYNPEILKEFLKLNSIFKFVVDEKRDLEEVVEIIEEVGIDAKRVFLMPQGRTPEELHQRGPWVARMCKSKGFNFTPRIHVDLWGAKRGV